MEQFKNYSSWREDTITIKAGEVYDLIFMQTKPNMFYIQNTNSTVLYVSMSKYPRRNSHEFKISGNTSETIGRPNGTGHLYIFNPSTESIDLKVYSIADKFDINVLKNLSVNVDGATFESDGIVRGFQSGVSIPAGNNTIGSVEMATESKAILSQISSYCNNLMAIKNQTTGTYENTRDVAWMMSDDSRYSGTNFIKQIAEAMQRVLMQLGVTDAEYQYLNNVTSFSYTRETGSTESKVHFCWLCYDGGTTATVKKGDAELLTIMAGEAFTDLEFELAEGETLTITSTEPMYRIKYFTH